MKAPIFSRRGFRSVLNIFKSAVIILYSALEIGLSQKEGVLCIQTVNEKIVRSRYSLPRKKKTINCFSLAKLLRVGHNFVYAHVVIVLDILRSEDAQCNSVESP